MSEKRCPESGESPAPKKFSQLIEFENGAADGDDDIDETEERGNISSSQQSSSQASISTLPSVSPDVDMSLFTENLSLTSINQVTNSPAFSQTLSNLSLSAIISQPDASQPAISPSPPEEGFEGNFIFEEYEVEENDLERNYDSSNFSYDSLPSFIDDETCPATSAELSSALTAFKEAN